MDYIIGSVDMKISTRGRYGLMAMVDLAVDYGECKSLIRVAKRQGLSEAYLEQLIIPLKKAGFVEGTRGAQGGYCLSRPPTAITAGEILKTLEGSLYPVDCLSDEEGASCGTANCDLCATKSLWLKMYDRMSDLLESVTLADLVRDYQGKDKLKAE